jgi:hypothetical protein
VYSAECQSDVSNINIAYIFRVTKHAKQAEMRTSTDYTALYARRKKFLITTVLKNLKSNFTFIASEVLENRDYGLRDSPR